jgi:hypothetical protein
MADIRIKYGRSWIVFLIVTLIGAGMMTSQNPLTVRWGIILLLVPLALTGGVLTLFYLLSRRQDDDSEDASMP